MIVCLHQFIRPTSETKVDFEGGCGDCTICMPDKNNKYCIRYYKINITEIDVVEDHNYSNNKNKI